MTLRQIQYVVAIERMGSLSNAAKTLFISQSTLSFAIKDLERELGFSLFERTRTGMRPTEGGRLFLEKAHNALNAFSELETLIPESRAEVSQLNVVSVQSSFLSEVFRSFARELENAGSPFRLKYKQCETGEVVDELCGGEYDMGVVYATDRQELAWKQDLALRGLDAQRICTFEICAIFSADDPLAARSTVSLSELSAYTFVYCGDDSLNGFSNLADYSAINFNLNEHRRYVDVQDTQLLNHLIREPGRFTIGHRPASPDYAAGLSYVPLRDRQNAHLLLLRSGNSPLSDQAEQLLDLMRAKAASSAES